MKDCVSPAQADRTGIARAVRREFGEINRFLSSTAGKLAGLGAGFALGSQIRDSAMLDKTEQVYREVCAVSAVNV